MKLCRFQDGVEFSGTKRQANKSSTVVNMVVLCDNEEAHPKGGETSTAEEDGEVGSLCLRKSDQGLAKGEGNPAEPATEEDARKNSE